MHSTHTGSRAACHSCLSRHASAAWPLRSATTRRSLTTTTCAGARGRDTGSSAPPPSRHQRTPLTPELKKLLLDNFGELAALPKEEPPPPKVQPQKRKPPPAKKIVQPTSADPKVKRNRQPRPFSDLMHSFQQDSSSESDVDDGPSTSSGAAPYTSHAEQADGSSYSSRSTDSDLAPSPRGTAAQRSAGTSTSGSTRSSSAPSSRRAPPSSSTTTPHSPHTSTSTSTTRKPKPKPLYKGDLALPGGANWSSFRKQIRPRSEAPGLPFVDAVIVVEGEADHAALNRAVSAPSYICDGTRLFQEFAEREVKALTRLRKEIIVLTDPDERGLEMRLHLDNLIGPLHHAFVPVSQATSSTADARHEEGNRGVEHAPPAAIRSALQCVVQSFGEARKEFSMQDLVDAQLVNLMGSDLKNAAFKRQVFCGELGVGVCNGKKLLRVLNRFVTREHFRDVLERTEAELEQLGVVVGLE